MNRKTAGTLRPVAALLALAGLLLAGCTTVYHPRYGSDGVYYDDGPYYGEGPVVHRSRHAAPVWVANPVIYPYWSLDYFYFSHYVHPYSVYVGYHEPYYYPYPGWTLGHYWSHHGYHHRPRFSVSVGYGWGYPWSAYGWHYPSFAFGFFSDWRVHHHYGYARHHRYHRDRLRAIDQRIDRLRFRSDRIDRRALLAGRDDRGRAVPWTGTSGTVRTLAERGPSLRTEPTLSRRDAVNRAGAERGSMRDGLRRGSSASPRATTGTATPRGTIRGRGDFRSREAAPSRRGIPMDRFESRSRRSDALSGSREA
ncbi:MAG: hypothetical protein R3323_10515, partial [Wenzhouxiangellaceae bacterium]|nr:hypothetical protein [Wenzhouxiangellaceae bacterium]